MDYAAEGRLRKMSVEKAWATIEELARYEDEGWNDLVAPGEGSLDYENPDIEQLLGVMECKFDTLMKEAISLMGRSESVFGMTSNTVNSYERGTLPYTKKCLIKSTLCQTRPHNLPSPPLVRESTFGFKPGTKNNQNIKSRHDTENLSPQSTPQDLLSFEVYTPPVTYPKEVEKTLGTQIEVESLDETQLEDLRLNIYNHDIPLSSREVPSFDEPEPQPNPLPNYPSLDVSLGKERGS
ncbi:hypothetical protein Tco_0453613 [Tanacetum coccineum]